MGNPRDWKDWRRKLPTSKTPRNSSPSSKCPSLFRQDRGIIEGIIDLAFRDESVWTVVDFKTNLELATALRDYWRQVGLYCAAITAAAGQQSRGFLPHLCSSIPAYAAPEAAFRTSEICYSAVAIHVLCKACHSWRTPIWNFRRLLINLRISDGIELRQGQINAGARARFILRIEADDHQRRPFRSRRSRNRDMSLIGTSSLPG
jgi:hypothetical protein